MITICRASASCALVACCLSVTAPALAQAPAPTANTSIFASLFGDTISDFRRLPSSETLTLLGIGAAAAAIGHTKDWSVTNRFSVSRLEDTFEAGQLIGGARFQLGGALATYTLGRLTGHTRVAEMGADLFRAQVVAQALTAGVKLSVRRIRPDGSEFSFPSGHTSATFASATVLQRHLGWKVGVPAYAVASYVAASRIQVKRHFLSDVAFGAALGVIAGRTVTVGRGQATFAVAPTAAPGGAGVSFTWVGKR